jgi:phage gpG-like protein
MARIIDHSQEIINATNEAIYNALEIIGAKAADYAAGKAPVDTGRLKNSLTHEVAMDEKAVYVGTNVEYAPFVEYGHKTQSGKTVAGKPFLKPAIESHLDEYKHILEEELKM